MIREICHPFVSILLVKGAHAYFTGTVLLYDANLYAPVLRGNLFWWPVISSKYLNKGGKGEGETTGE